MRSAMMRAEASVAPAGGNGTIIVIGEDADHRYPLLRARRERPRSRRAAEQREELTSF